MNKLALITAMKEAKRFLSKGQAYLEREKDDKYAQYGCRESGAAKRASMDLTMALVDVRKPR